MDTRSSFFFGRDRFLGRDLAMRGAAPAAIQALAGHHSVSATQRYMHLAPIALKATVALLEQPIPKEEGDAEMAT